MRLVLLCLVLLSISALCTGAALRDAFRKQRVSSESSAASSLHHLLPSSLHWGATATPFFRFRARAPGAPDWNLIKTLPNSYIYAKGRVSAIPQDSSEDLDLDKFLSTQLARDGRRDAMNNYLRRFAQLAGFDAPNKDLWDEALKNCLMLLYAASVNDPTYYVSHAADHGARVMILAQSFSNLEGVVKALHKQILNIPITETLDPEKKVDVVRLDPKIGKMKVPQTAYVNFIVDTMHLLHDVGYSGLPYGISPKFKWTHAINGAELINAKLKDSLGKILPKAHFELIVEAVRSHNWDSTSCNPTACEYTDTAFNTNDNHNPDTALFPPGGVGIVPQNDVKKLMKRGFLEFSLKEGDKFGPSQWLLRLADNGDAARNRLTPGQRNIDVMSCWRDLSVDCSVSQARDDIRKANPKGDLSDDDIDKKKGSLASCLKVKANAELYSELVAPKSVNHFSFLHYYSNYVISRSFTKGKSESGKQRMAVEFFPDLPAELAVSSFIGPAAYQIMRMADACNTLYQLDGQTVTASWEIELINFPAKGQTRVIPLSAFSRDSAAVTGQCQLFNDNFAAPQKCFKDGKATDGAMSPLDKSFVSCTPASPSTPSSPSPSPPNPSSPPSSPSSPPSPPSTPSSPPSNPSSPPSTPSSSPARPTRTLPRP